MKNFLIGLVVGIVLCGLTALIFVFAMVRFAGSFAERPVTVADGSTLVMKLEGDVPEKSPAEIPLPFFEAQTPLTVEEVWDTLHKASADPRIKGIIFETAYGLTIPAGRKLQEIRDDILTVQEVGQAHHHLSAGAQRPRILPGVRDRPHLPGARRFASTSRACEWKPCSYKNTLDKVGVKADVFHAGKYKDAGDILTQTSMTPETSEVLNQILDQYYGNLVRDRRARAKETAGCRARHHRPRPVHGQ